MKTPHKKAILSGVSSLAKKTRHRRSIRWFLPVLCTAVLSGTSTQAGLPALGSSGASDRELAQLGKAAMQNAQRINPVLNDVELHDYLNSLMATLSSANGLDDVGIELTVFKNRSINAFALPGGYIGVFAGLMLSARSESALVSVLAHELAHLSQRHIHRFIEHQSQASLAATAALVAAALVMRKNPNAAQATIYSGLANANQNLLNYSRAHESEADRVGQRMMSRAGFRPKGMAEMFERLAQKEQLNRRQGIEYLQTHPVTQSRVADAWESARTFGKRQGEDDPLTFKLLQARLAVLVGGSVSNDTRPYADALVALRAHDAAVAKKKMAKLPDIYRSHRSVIALQARIEAALGNINVALKALDSVQTNYPHWYPGTHYRAELLSLDGQHDRAADTLQSHLRKFGSDWPDSYQTLSIYCRQAGDELNALRWLAEHHLSQENYTGAASLFEQALGLSKGGTALEARLHARLEHTQERALQERPFE